MKFTVIGLIKSFPPYPFSKSFDLQNRANQNITKHNITVTISYRPRYECVSSSLRCRIVIVTISLKKECREGGIAPAPYNPLTLTNRNKAITNRRFPTKL